MYKITILFSICCLFFSYSNLFAQKRFTIEEYIETYQDIVIEHRKTYGIPASIKMAQAILESAFGNSDLARNAHNHFGIKCHDWQGETYLKDDDKKDDCFRKYKDPIESFVDHSIFLSTRKRYAFLFDLDKTDYKAWAHGLKQAGYATNPKYPDLLINLIEKHNLSVLDSKTDKEINIKPLKPTQTITENPTSAINREVKTNNRVKYIVSQRGDSFEKIATDMNMRTWQLYRYNELEKTNAIKENQIIYLQPKRRRSYEFKTHIVEKGEDVYSVSQKYAIKTKHLFRLNPDLHPDGYLKQGEVINLRRSY